MRITDQTRNEWYTLVIAQNEALNEYFEIYKAATDKQGKVVAAAKAIYDKKAAEITERMRELKNMEHTQAQLFC